VLEVEELLRISVFYAIRSSTFIFSARPHSFCEFTNASEVQNLELNNLNHIEFNPTLTLTTLFPQKISRLPASKSLYLGNIARRIVYL